MSARRLLLLFVLVLGIAESGSALPVFARRYETSCTTCHAIIPKLNPFGIAFRNNLYRIPLADEKLLKSPDISLGAPAWKQLWPKAVWPGKIPGLPPVAFRAAADVDLTPSQPVHTNFDFPDFLSIYFVGPAGDSLSFFADLFMIGSTNQIFIDRAWIQFRLTPEKPGDNWAVLKLGRIDLRAEPFSSTYRKTTAQNYNVSTYSVFSDGFKFFSRDAGVELWGAATGPDNRGGLEYAAGVVQGSAGAPENNNYKDPYWAASYKFGGHGVVGSRKESGDEIPPIRNYAENSIMVGTFGYRGKDITRSTGTPLEYQFTRTGAKVDAYWGNLNVYGTVVTGQDNLHDVVPKTINSSAFYVESDYMLEPWIMPLVRFEKTNFSDRRNVEQVIPAINFAIRANVRVLAEGHFFNRLSFGNSVRTGINEGLVRLEFLF